jgi:hypothetical protein
MRKLAMALWISVIAVTAQATDWPQFGYDAAHSGFNRAETSYTTLNGNRFLHSFSLNKSADSAPIYVANVNTASGAKNVLFIDTKDGTIMAIDADASSLQVIWSHQPMPAGGTNDSNGAPSGAPIVDPLRQYVYAYGLDGKVHKYDIGTGHDETTTCAVNTFNCWPEVVTLKPDVEKGAASLSMSAQADYLYSITDGYDGDGGDYQGHLTAINLSTGTQNVFNGLCSDQKVHFQESTPQTQRTPDCDVSLGGAWGRAGAVYDPVKDHVIFVTGNGDYNADSGGVHWGDSVLALSRDGSSAGSNGLPMDAYTPQTAQQLNDTDADLGSVSITLVPAPAGTAAQFTDLAVLPGGKDSCVRLINLAHMGSSLVNGVGTPQRGGELQQVQFPVQPPPPALPVAYCNGISEYPREVITTQAAVWVNPADSSTWVYIANGYGMAAFKVVLQTINSIANTPQLQQQWTNTNGGTSPVIANGTLYYLSGSSVLALNPTTGASAVAGSTSWATTSTGGFHWQSPIVVNSRLYAIDNGDPATLWVFNLDGLFKGKFE